MKIERKTPEEELNDKVNSLSASVNEKHGRCQNAETKGLASAMQHMVEVFRAMLRNQERQAEVQKRQAAEIAELRAGKPTAAATHRRAAGHKPPQA
jgi:hypothetical protein